MEDQENSNPLSDPNVQNVNLNVWPEQFQEKEVVSQDLLLLSHFLSDSYCKSSVKDVQICMGLSDADVQNALPSAQRVSSSSLIPKQKFVHQLLHVWWEKNQYKETWGELLSCLEKLGDQSLMENVRKGHFEGKHDKETIKKYTILTSLPQEENNPHDCDLSKLVCLPEGIYIDEADLIDEEAVVQQSTNPIVQQSNQVYKMLLQKSPNFIRDRGSVPALSDPDLARVKSVREKMKKLQRKFASLLRKSFVAFQCMPDSAGGLRVFLNQLCADEKGSIQLFEKQVLVITSHSTVEETFLLMSQMGAWDFINYHMLESVISEFELGDLSQPMNKHNEEIGAFMDETYLSDYLIVWDGCREMKSMIDRAPVIAKLKDKWGTYTLADIAKKQSVLASGFRLTSIVLQFEKAVSGSFYIMWSVPLAAAAYMQRMMESSNRPDFAQYGIEELVIGEKVNKICRKDDVVYEELYTESIEHPEIFWKKMAFKLLQWTTPFETTNSSDIKMGTIQWFRGGQLNVSVNCLDRHVSTDSSDHNERVALIWVNHSGYEKVTYRKLLAMTCQVANVLKKKGIAKGDTVAIYMSAIPLAVASMLACNRIGAVHCVIFPAYCEQALKQRLKDVNAKVIITVDEATIGRNKYRPKSVVDAVLNASDANDGKPTTVLVVRTSDDPSAMKMRACDSLLEEEMKHQPTECTPVPMDSEDPLCVVYSSGTGKDDSKLKPLYLSQAGYLVYNTLGHKYIFNCKPGDVFCCLAGLGWLAGQNYVVYGPLANGGTSVLFECSPYGGRCLKTIDELKVTHFFTVPEVYKQLSTMDDSDLFQNYDLSSLKVIVTAGDVMPSDVETWCLDKLGKGRCSFIDVYGQTELGGIVLVKRRGICPSHFPKTKCTFPFFGVTAVLKKTSACKTNDSYELLIDNYCSMPGIARNVVEVHPNLFKDNAYSTSDMVKMNKQDGVNEMEDYWINGRVDDPVIQLNAKYWGVAEIESHVTNTVNLEIGTVPKVNVIVLPSESGRKEVYYVWVVTVSSEELQKTATKLVIITVVDRALKDLFEVTTIPPLKFVFTDYVPKTFSGKRMNYVLFTFLSKSLFGSPSISVDQIHGVETVRAQREQLRCALRSDVVE